MPQRGVERLGMSFSDFDCKSWVWWGPSCRPLEERGRVADTRGVVTPGGQVSSTVTGTARPSVWPTGEVATTLSCSLAMSSDVASASIDTRAVIVL